MRRTHFRSSADFVLGLRGVAVVGQLAALPDRRDEECDILVIRLGQREEDGARLGELAGSAVVRGSGRCTTLGTLA